MRAIPGASLPGNLARCTPSSGCRTSAWPQCSRENTPPPPAPAQLRPKAVTIRAVRRDSRPYRCGTGRQIVTDIGADGEGALTGTGQNDAAAGGVALQLVP